MNRSSKGFTLIELLVVVGIIALISSIALAALSFARLRAQDTAVKREMTELRTLLARELNDTGSYTGIKNGGGVKAQNATCAQGNFSGSYATDAKRICDALVKASSANNACGSFCVRFNLPSGSSNSNRFSIEAYLPYESMAAGSPRFLCMGSSGNSSVSTGQTWTESGCSQNP